MLNKEICKACKKNTWGVTSDESWVSFLLVVCPIKFTEGIHHAHHISEGPPAWCPHKFKQAVADGMSDA
jgi:hypothetical protein